MWVPWAACLYVTAALTAGLCTTEAADEPTASPLPRTQHRELLGERVFLTKAAAGWKKITKGSLGHVVDADVDDTSAVAVEVKGILVEAPLHAVQVLPPLRVGDGVEVHYDTDTDTANIAMRSPAVVTELRDTSALVLFDGLYLTALPRDTLVPECFGRGTRSSEGSLSRTGQRRCVCREGYSGFHCLLTAPDKSGDTGPTVLSRLSSFLSGLADTARGAIAQKDTAAVAGGARHTEPLSLVWEGVVYPLVLPVAPRLFKKVISRSVYTLVVACYAWETLCDVALDTVSRVWLNGTSDFPPKYFGHSTEVAKQKLLQRVWVDADIFNTTDEGMHLPVKRGSPTITLFTKFSDKAVATYDGELWDTAQLFHFVSAVSRATPKLQSHDEVVGFLGQHDVVVLSDPAGLKSEVVRHVAVSLGIPHAAVPAHLQVCGECLPSTPPAEPGMSLFIRLLGTQFTRIDYRGNAHDTEVWRWVRAHATPIVTSLGNANFDKALSHAQQLRAAMVIAAGPPADEVREAAVRARAAGGGVMFFSIDTVRRAEFLRRVGHGRYIVVLPAGGGVRWASAAPLTLAEAQAAPSSVSASALATHQSTLAPPVSLAGVFSLTEVSVRQLHDSCRVDVACCHSRGDCAQCKGGTEWRRMLVVVRTTWCWHCKAVVPALEVVGRKLQGSDTLVADLVADEALLPGWLRDAVQGYPDVFLLERGADELQRGVCTSAGVRLTRLMGGDRSPKALLDFAKRSLPAERGGHTRDSLKMEQRTKLRRRVWKRVFPDTCDSE